MSCMCVFKLFLRDDLRDFVNLSNLVLVMSLKKKCEDGLKEKKFIFKF